MKKVLFVASIDQHIRHFHLPYLRWFKRIGYEVHVASKGNELLPNVDVKHQVGFERSPLKINNILAFFQLRNIINENSFDIVHCHTPVGGTLARLAAKFSTSNASIIYTAHGFHFYKGAPRVNWVFFYLLEKYLSRYTDQLITINEEDYSCAVNNNFKSKSTKLVNGVGVDLSVFRKASPKIKNALRQDYGYLEDDFILIYVGELSARKNQSVLIDSMALLKKKIPKIKLLFVGKGNKRAEYSELCKELDVEGIVEFLGYRNDIPKLMQLSDVTVSTAIQEGLPVNLMEAQASGLPCIVSNCRGNRDVVVNGETGTVIENINSINLSDEIFMYYQTPKMLESYGKNALINANNFSIKVIMPIMQSIYLENLN